MDGSERCSDRVRAVPPSGIRKFFDLANSMEGVVSLGVGEPDYAAPDAVIEACVESLRNKQTSYTSNLGLLRLREDIAKMLEKKHHVSYDPAHEIIVTVGVSEGIGLAMTALLNPGDEVLIPDPAYVAYPACVSIAGGVPVYVPTYEENDFCLTVEELEKRVTPKTKAMIIGYPNNPTGTVMTREQLIAIADFAERHDLIVVADEIYCDLTYDGTHTCFASLPGMKERTILLNGFSKSYAMTGLRIGYACAPAGLLNGLYKVHQYTIMCASVTSQYGAIAALEKCDADVESMVEEYRARREIVYEGLLDAGLHVFKPKGAFYAFPDITVTGMNAEEFAERLLMEEKVAVVPGTAFGQQGEGHVRISYAASRENIREALQRIKRFVAAHRK
jgi:aminotransferase